MPELPEVETIVQGLKAPLCNRKINNVFVRDERIVGYPDNLKDFKNKLEGYDIISLGRRGKYIIIEISSGKLLIIHLRMTGQLLIKDRGEEIAKHTHIILQLDNSTDLRFNNVRKFGRMYL
ncbi:MAG: DNA-formamidopyrimidine glycosylase family protein, partial [Halarsenatibacteraceae bacterium]